MNTDKNTPENDDDFDGFDAHDDDSFALENLEQYPGDLSKFEETAIPMDENAWDAGNEKSEKGRRSMDSSAPQYQNSDEESPLPPLPKANAFRSALGEGSDKSVPFVRSGAIDDDIDGSQYSSSKEVLEPKNSGNDSDMPSAKVYEKIDDEWVLLLKNDLKRSEDRKSSVPKEIQPNQSTTTKEFKAVEDSDSTDEIDLSDFNAHHPSTYRLDEDEVLLLTPQPELDNFPPDSSTPYSSYATMAAEMAAQTPEPPPEPVVPPAHKPSIPKPVKPPVDKKKRKAVFFWAAAALALLAVGYGGYRVYPVITALFDQATPVMPPTQVTQKETPAKLPVAKAELHDTVHAEVKATVDTVQVHEEHQLVAQTEPPKHEETKHVIDEKPKEISKSAIEPVKKIENKVEMPKEQQKQPEVPVVKRNIASKSITHNNLSASTSQSKAVTPVFTVQVYSSPSKDDATERLERLKSHNAENISMSEQLVRGKTWYRVRFGSFGSRDEAEAAAKQHGFAQSWIDRIR